MNDIQRRSFALRRRLATDPHRPTYHFLPPANWMNDPNGLIQWQERYHLFYQYNPTGSFWARPVWGHTSSADLLHWTDLPLALVPDLDGPDRDGCYSGCLVDNHGVPTIIYTGVQPERPCLATSSDGLLTWQKHPTNPIIPAPPPDLDVTGFRDHCIWFEGDHWLQIIGAGIRGSGGAALLYRSNDLLHWEYLHPLWIGDLHAGKVPWSGTMWECPDFFPLSDRQVLIVSAYDHQQHQQLYPLWMSGKYAEGRFRPDASGKVDAGGNTFYAPQSLLDDQGRRIMFGWIKEDRSAEEQLAAGWAGLASLPRILSLLPDGSLGAEPAPELASLRGPSDAAASTREARAVSIQVKGDALEIAAEFAPVAQDETEAFGLAVRCSPNGAEQTLILYDPHAGRLLVERSRSSLNPDVAHGTLQGPLDLAGGESLRLHVFLDRSVLEVFANGRFCLTARIYPAQPDSLGVGLVDGGGRSELQHLAIWEMKSIWSDVARVPG